MSLSAHYSAAKLGLCSVVVEGVSEAGHFLELVDVALTVDFVLNFAWVVVRRLKVPVASVCVVAVLENRLHEVLGACMLIEWSVRNFIMVLDVVRSESFSVTHAMEWLIIVEIKMAVGGIRVVHTVHVAHLTAVESWARLFNHGLLDDEVVCWRDVVKVISALKGTHEAAVVQIGVYAFKCMDALIAVTGFLNADNIAFWILQMMDFVFNRMSNAMSVIFNCSLMVKQVMSGQLVLQAELLIAMIAWLKITPMVRL